QADGLDPTAAVDDSGVAAAMKEATDAAEAVEEQGDDDLEREVDRLIAEAEAAARGGDVDAIETEPDAAAVGDSTPFEDVAAEETAAVEAVEDEVGAEEVTDVADADDAVEAAAEGEIVTAAEGVTNEEAPDAAIALDAAADEASAAAIEHEEAEAIEAAEGTPTASIKVVDEQIAAEADDAAATVGPAGIDEDGEISTPEAPAAANAPAVKPSEAETKKKDGAGNVVDQAGAAATAKDGKKKEVVVEASGAAAAAPATPATQSVVQDDADGADAESDSGARSKVERAIAVAYAALVAVNAPLKLLPESVRDTVGWIALNTVFIAFCVWIYLLLR
ncbi:MAG: hypothetical protein VYC34_11505, partial [Planctomycetota bacterium]|nr:hypothetical protein [Planctomycetota bacterium]